MKKRTHLVPLNIEVDGRHGAVAQSDSYQNVVFVGYNV